MPENKNIKVALVGNPNSGKSTIFNSLTGATQNVGNYPGITVERKEYTIKYNDYNITFVDLPGIYSLTAHSNDEIVTKNFLINKNFDIIVNIIDSSNIERSLYLFSQITEFYSSIIIVLNMIDILKYRGKQIDGSKMEDLLGVPVLATVANKNIGITNILASIVATFENNKVQKQTRAKVDYTDVIKEEINKLTPLIQTNSEFSIFPKNWVSLKLLENDTQTLNLIKNTQNKDKILQQLQKSINHIKEHFNQPPGVIIAETRYGFANSIVKTILKNSVKNKIDITEAIDTFVLNKYLAIPIFALAMYMIFKFTFTFSEPLVNIFDIFFRWIGTLVANILPSGQLKSLIIDGIISGVGSVLKFFPLVLFMFFAIAFFEDSGYMARTALVMDKVMSKFGLGGKSFFPLMLSTNGCAVPGILAARTLESNRARLITIFVVPFMICGAKFPVFALIISTFIPIRYQTLTMFIMYILSIAVALSVTKILDKIIPVTEMSHFVIELPPYHVPTLKGLCLKMWERGWLYVKKAGTLILFASILIWAAFAYPRVPQDKNIGTVSQMNYSFAGRVGDLLEPVFKPIGMDKNIAITLISGFAAKEIIVSTLGTVYSIEEGTTQIKSLKDEIKNDKNWSPLKGITFLIFCLIYMPCISSVVVFFKETNYNCKWLLAMVLGNTLLAWVCSFIVFKLGSFLRIGIC
ncbi:MAG: ferrous iron transport protein B [Endomicrobium sp.]|jgi:ferrous iron transport protein B|uniref:ferrous iron transport protein B n=1 Tax=Candidatus Endomicrobiellum cubanum TaxID=3242325 RepID=UPI0028387787|nr:ferrous iron transport protein B [Endomicrobium sp.]